MIQSVGSSSCERVQLDHTDSRLFFQEEILWMSLCPCSFSHSFGLSSAYTGLAYQELSDDVHEFSDDVDDPALGSVRLPQHCHNPW
ncbi:hypothetical protein ACFX19_032096 [Malus domestica]